MITHRLKEAGADPRKGSGNLFRLRHEAGLLLSAMVHAGHAGSDTERQAAFAAGTRRLVVPGVRWRIEAPEACAPKHLGPALDALMDLPDDSRARLLQGLAHAAAWDGRILPGEYALLRVAADALGCPLPPRVPAGLTPGLKAAYSRPPIS